MAWAWVRPTDLSVLEGRPLLDLGAGDGQTLSALVDGDEAGVVALDRSLDALRAAGQTGINLRVCGHTRALPFGDGQFATVVAGDVFHHMDDEALAAAFDEIVRVLASPGTLVAWWYELPGREAPDAPRYPRAYSVVAAAAGQAGFSSISPIDLTTTVDAGPPTVGLVARV